MCIHTAVSWLLSLSLLAFLLHGDRKAGGLEQGLGFRYTYPLDSVLCSGVPEFSTRG